MPAAAGGDPEGPRGAGIVPSCARAPLGSAGLRAPPTAPLEMCGAGKLLLAVPLGH